MAMSGACRLLTVLLAALSLTGCATPDPAPWFAKAAAAGFEPPRVIGPQAPFVAMARWGEHAGGVLTVYVEGDGAAWSPAGPPANPTPLMPVALDLAIADPGAPLLYLGRPCQFMAWQEAACPVRLWAGGRFGADVVAAMDVAVIDAEQRSGASRLVLVGFSGGAAAAALLALRHPETVLLVTVAGVVDHAAWTRLHRVAPLEKSLNPAYQGEKLARIRQMHLVGTEDRIVPPALIEGLVARYGDRSAATIMTTPNGHDCCWSEGWAAWIAAQRAALAS